MKTLEGQNIIDMSIQSCGSVEAAYDMCILKGISLSDDLNVSEDVQAVNVIDKSIVAYYASKKIQPATADDFVLSDSRIFSNEFSQEFS